MFLKFDIDNENSGIEIEGLDGGQDSDHEELETHESTDETPIDEVEGESLGWREKVLKMATEVAARESCEIYDFEFVGAGGSRALRVYIDKIGEGGVSIEDCSNVSRGLNLLLDVDDVIPGGAYNLEVSSPGLERSLRTAAHFKRAIGKRVQIKSFESFAELNPQLEDALRVKLGKAKQLEGLVAGLESATGEEVVSAADEKSARLVFDAENGGHVVRVKVPLGKITKASTVFIFEKHEKKQSKSAEKGGKGHGKHK
jgi:ribosome maturation factor RimP